MSDQTPEVADATGDENLLVQTNNGPEEGQPAENQDPAYVPGGDQ